MDEISSGATESVSTAGSTENTTATTQQASQPQAAQTTTEVSTQGTGTPPVSEYTPNLKFKVFDKEHEFDEWIRPVINKDNEEKVRDLYTRAFGLEPLKQKYESTKEKLSRIEPEHTKIMTGLNELNDYLTKGDMDNFFKKLQIPENTVYKWVLDKLNYENLPPEERQKMDQSRQMQTEVETLRKQNEMIQQQYQQQLVQHKSMALENSLARQEVKQVADSFDSRMGRAGAFRDEVIKRGILHYQLTGQDLSPEEAIREALVVIGGPTASAATPTAEAVEKPVPVIPNVSGRGSAPARKTVKSLDDIKRIANNL